MSLPLRRLVVENYKSLRSLELALGNLTVFLGANAVGKSNIFDALKFIKGRVEKGVWNALQAHGGMELCAWRGSEGQAQSFMLNARLGDGRTEQQSLEYKLVLSQGGPRGAQVGLEELRSPSDQRTWMATRGENTRFLDAAGNQMSTGAAERDLIHYNVPGPVSEFVKEVQGWQFYNFIPALMRDPGQAKREDRLEEKGRNFCAWLHWLQARHGKAFDEVVSLLRDAIETAREVSTELTSEATTFMLLEEEGLSGPLPIRAISDGTLRFLAMLAVLHQPEPPTLLCLEEPENNIHPRLMEMLSDELKAASKHFPVMVSTHSPLLVDRFEPANIVIVEKREGATAVHPIGTDEELLKMIREMEFELGEIWYSGALGGVQSRKLD